MAELFASGRIIYGIVLLMLMEFALLASLRKKSSRGLSASALLANFGSGAALLMALRAALVGSAWHIIASWLVVALLAHLLDLRLRWA